MSTYIYINNSDLSRGEWVTFAHGAHCFFAICGSTSGCLSSISAEYYFHHRPSFAVESSLIHVTTFIKLKKEDFARVIETFSNHQFSWFLLEIKVHLFKIHHKEAPSINGAAANLSIKSVLFFKKKFGNILKKMGWGRFAHALVGHIRACLFNVLWLLVKGTVPAPKRSSNLLKRLRKIFAMPVRPRSVTEIRYNIIFPP